MADSLLSWSPAAALGAVTTTDDLIRHCLSGEESAYFAVYNHYAASIYRLCYGFLQHREDAEEVLQDTFEYAFRKLDHFDGRKASFKTWLYQIAISRCRNKRRRKWLPTLALGQLLGQEVADPSTPGPDELLSLTEQQRQVWQALGKLSTKLRETAVLRYYEGLTYAEIGDFLAIPTKTAESRMRLAHKELRALLADEFEPANDNSVDAVTG
jgi:RNA polymerase sigma-70 factor, ECF subfamily